MTTVSFDPTAGERARQIAEWPEGPQPILDPTAGERARRIARWPELIHAIVDPTDPRYREHSPV